MFDSARPPLAIETACIVSEIILTEPISNLICTRVSTSSILQDVIFSIKSGYELQYL